MTSHQADPAARTIAVIGGGPRGIAAVERLLANAPDLGIQSLDIQVIEPYRPGGGRVWDADQPSHLLMNTLCADATHFTDDTVEIRGPLRPGPALYDWAQQIVAGTVRDLGRPERPLDAEHHREAEQMQPHSHPSRRILGGYLEWCHAQDLAAAPVGAQVTHVPGIAQRITPGGERWRISVAGAVPPTDPGHDPSAPVHDIVADAVILATGHADAEPAGRGAEITAAAQAAGLWLGAPTSPISQHALEELEAGQSVIVRGLGMNFFDYMSLLTIGRGGVFEEDPEGPDALRYVPSGREPHLVVGSGRGIPYRAKGRFGQMTPVFPKHHMTSELVAHLIARAGSGDQVDFRRDLYPQVMKDGAHLYYERLAEQRPAAFAGDVAEILTALQEHDWDSAPLRAVIERIVPDPEDRLEVPALDRPLDGLEFPDAPSLTAWWLADLRRDVAEANLGMASALKCASVQIGAGRGPLRTLVRFGGVTGPSYRDDVEGWFRGFAGMLASGPPARRIDELIALVKAGIVEPLGARMRVVVRDGRYVASSPSVPGLERTATALLEAHLPPADFPHSANPVLHALREDGLGRAWEIPGADGAQPVPTGALEVGPAPYRVVDATGREQAGLYAVGVPLESILWGTQLQPLARTNSRFLRELDEVARDALLPGVDAQEAPQARDPEREHAEESA